MATDAPVAAAPVAPAVAGAAAPAAPKPATKISALWVGDLNPEVDEALLYQIFGGNQTPSVVSNIRVCRNHQTRESLGYAYVNFANSVDAEAALQRLNYQPINGRVCRIAWSQRDPTVRRSNVGNIFVKNLGPEIDTKQLHDTFKEFGQILSCKVATDKQGISKGYGFVHFEAEAAAKLAIETVNGLPFNGRNVEVMPYLPRQLRSGPEWNNLYVKNLPKGFTKKDLEDLFSPYGEIFSSLLATDGETGASKGYGFVCFKTHAAALAAVEKLNGKEMDGEPASIPPFKKAKKEGAEAAEEATPAPATDRKLVLFVGRALKKAERERAARERDEQNRREKHAKWAGCNLYVRNLDETIDDERLRKEFAPHGTINSAVVAKDTEGRSKLFGYVCFSSAEEATKALQAMHHKMLVGKPLFVAPWQPKEARQAAMAQAQAARAANSRNVAATAGAGQAGLTPQMASVFSQLQSNPQVFAMMFYAVMMQQASLMNGGSNPNAFAAYQQMMRQGSLPRANAATTAALLQQLSAAGVQQGAVAAPAAPQRAPGFLGAVQGGQAPMQGTGPRPGPARNTSGPKPTGPRPAPGATAPRPPVAGGARPAAPGSKSPSGRPGQPGPQAAYRSNARNVDEAAAAATMSMLAAAAAGMQGLPATAAVPTAQPGMVLVPTSSLPGAQPAVPAVQDSTTFASTLANASSQQRRQLIGEKLYAQIRPVVGERAGKITGMLLDGIDESELLHLLESPEELTGRINEALDVLRKAVNEGAPQ